MSKKVKGVKHLGGDTYLLDYQARLERHQERIHAASMSEARAIRDERKVALRKQVPAPQNGQERMNGTFDDGWAKVEENTRAANCTEKYIARSKKIYDRVFGEFLPKHYPSIKSPSQLNLQFFQDYQSHFVNILKRDPDGGWGKELCHIKTMLQRLRRAGFCGKDLIEEMKDMPCPESVKKEYHDIPKELWRKLLAVIKEEKPHFYYLLYYILRTGRRITETLMLEKQDVVWEGLNPVRINIRAETTKTKTAAPMLTLDEDLRDAIRASIQRNRGIKTKYLFPNEKGKICRYDRVRLYLRKVSPSILGVEITPHFLRHRFMTECGKARVAFADVSKISVTALTHQFCYLPLAVASLECYPIQEVANVEKHGQEAGSTRTA